MASYIHIPEPCHESWDLMQPLEQGRHCLQCCKTVVDFTGWEMADIASYLKDNANTKTCGRFKTEQLYKPLESTEVLVQKVWHSSAPFYRKIAAVIVLFFAVSFTSCNKETIDAVQSFITSGQPQEPQIMGLITAPPPPPPPPYYMLGEPAIEEKAVPDSTARQ